MGRFENSDRITNLERQLQELQDTVARLPVTVPTVEGPRNAVLLQSCDGTPPNVKRVADTVLPYVDSDDNRSQRRLSDAIGKVVQDNDGTCWQIMEKLKQCLAGECFDGRVIIDDCDQCQSCYLLESCDADPDIITHNVAVANFPVVMLDTGKCYTVSKNPNCANSVGVNVVAGWNTCAPCKCYVLKNCREATDTQTVMIEDPAGTLALNDVILWGGDCWELDSTATCTGNETIVQNEDWELMEDCDDARCKIYTLEPCPGQAGGLVDRYVMGAEDLSGARYDLSELVGKVVAVITTGTTLGCYTVVETDTGPTVETSPVVIYEVFDSCTGDYKCQAVRFKRVDPGESETCASPSASYFVTYSNINEQTNLAVPLAADNTFKRAEDGFCYIFQDYQDMDQADKDFAFTIEESYETCLECDDPRYRLMNKCGCGACDNSSEVVADIIADDSAVGGAVGKYVKVNGYCWLVEKEPSATAVTQGGDLGFAGPYNTCEECVADGQCITVLINDGGSIKWADITVSSLCNKEDASEPCPP